MVAGGTKCPSAFCARTPRDRYAYLHDLRLLPSGASCGTQLPRVRNGLQRDGALSGVGVLDRKTQTTRRVRQVPICERTGMTRLTCEHRSENRSTQPSRDGKEAMSAKRTGISGIWIVAAPGSLPHGRGSDKVSRIGRTEFRLVPKGWIVNSNQDRTSVQATRKTNQPTPT